MRSDGFKRKLAPQVPRVVSAVAHLVAGALVLLSLASLIQSVLQSLPVGAFSTGMQGTELARPYGGLRTENLTPTVVGERAFRGWSGAGDIFTRDWGTVIVGIEDLKVTERVMPLVLQVGLGQKAQAALENASTQEPIAAPDTACPGCPSRLALKPQYMGENVDVIIHGFQPAFEQSLNVPLKELFDGSASWLSDDMPFPGTPVTTEIPVAWHPEFYPSDAFVTQMEVSVFLPNDVRWHSAYPPNVVPSDVMVGLGDSSILGTMDVTVGQQHGDIPELAPLELRITRDFVTQTYSYLLLLVPSLIGLMLGSSRREPREGTSPDHLGFMLAVVASLLAIVPLRSVLVPPEVEGLTRADLILGLGISVLLLVGARAYEAHIRTVPEEHRGRTPVQQASDDP